MKDQSFANTQPRPEEEADRLEALRRSGRAIGNAAELADLIANPPKDPVNEFPHNDFRQEP